MASEAQTRNIRFLDAPVGGSKNQAEEGILVFLVGGNAADIEQARPFFEAMGSKILHVGENGMGTALKLVVNLQLGLSMAAFAEGLVLGESLGITQEMLLNVLVGGPVVAPFLAGKRAKLENHNYEAEFPLKWLQKDLQMASEAAYETQSVLPIGNITKELYQLAIKQGLGDSDFSAIYQFLQSD
jgi:3-hydroxyisobutyrate dehydrogenase-like beta-hydroxyacid dehydrogenase